MRRTLSILAVTLAGSLLALVPAGSASAHVHGINPLRCTPAADNEAGAIRAMGTPAGDRGLEDVQAPVAVIPIDKGGAVQLRVPDHFGVCSGVEL